jgi:hypothetical protein
MSHAPAYFITIYTLSIMINNRKTKSLCYSYDDTYIGQDVHTSVRTKEFNQKTNESYSKCLIYSVESLVWTHTTEAKFWLYIEDIEFKCRGVTMKSCECIRNVGSLNDSNIDAAGSDQSAMYFTRNENSNMPM